MFQSISATKKCENLAEFPLTGMNGTEDSKNINNNNTIVVKNSVEELKHSSPSLQTSNRDKELTKIITSKQDAYTNTSYSDISRNENEQQCKPCASKNLNKQNYNTTSKSKKYNHQIIPTQNYNNPPRRY